MDGRLASGSNDGTIKLWPKEGTGESVALAHLEGGNRGGFVGRSQSNGAAKATAFHNGVFATVGRQMT